MESMAALVAALLWIGALIEIGGVTDSSKYQSTDLLGVIDLQNRQASVRQLKKNFTFKQDSDPKHKGKSAQEWLQKKIINVLERPTQS